MRAINLLLWHVHPACLAEVLQLALPFFVELLPVLEIEDGVTGLSHVESVQDGIFWGYLFQIGIDADALEAVVGIEILEVVERPLVCEELAE
jgi:hypothetical protein